MQFLPVAMEVLFSLCSLTQWSSPCRAGSQFAMEFSLPRWEFGVSPCRAGSQFAMEFSLPRWESVRNGVLPAALGVSLQWNFSLPRWDFSSLFPCRAGSQIYIQLCSAHCLDNNVHAKSTHTLSMHGWQLYTAWSLKLAATIDFFFHPKLPCRCSVYASGTDAYEGTMKESEVAVCCV